MLENKRPFVLRTIQYLHRAKTVLKLSISLYWYQWVVIKVLGWGCTRVKKYCSIVAKRKQRKRRYIVTKTVMGFPSPCTHTRLEWTQIWKNRQSIFTSIEHIESIDLKKIIQLGLFSHTGILWYLIHTPIQLLVLTSKVIVIVMWSYLHYKVQLFTFTKKMSRRKLYFSSHRLPSLFLPPLCNIRGAYSGKYWRGV